MVLGGIGERSLDGSEMDLNWFEEDERKKRDGGR